MGWECRAGDGGCWGNGFVIPVSSNERKPLHGPFLRNIHHPFSVIASLSPG